MIEQLVYTLAVGGSISVHIKCLYRPYYWSQSGRFRLHYIILYWIIYFGIFATRRIYLGKYYGRLVYFQFINLLCIRVITLFIGVITS